MNRALNYIGIAKKANLLETGEENCMAAVRGGKAKLIILASDAAENAARRAKNIVYGKNVPLITAPFTKEEIAMCTGRPGCSMIVFTDIGLASSAVSAMAESDEAAYGECARELIRRQDKAAQRKLEAKAHERNKKMGRRSKA